MSQNGSSSILSVKNLNVFFKGNEGDTHAVKDLSFELQKSQTLAIVGESGSGKSVSSLAVLGLLNDLQKCTTEGEILFSGENILKQKETDLRKIRGKKIAMIFQEPMTSLNPLLKCGEQVREVLELHADLSDKEMDAEVLRLFNAVELPRPEQIIESYPHQISGGQKQRVMIAMALSCSPDILIADEPTTALDVSVQKSILHLIKKLQVENGTAVIFITHDLGVVAEIADEVMVMYRGDLLEKGPIKDVMANPAHPYTKGLIACKPRLNNNPNPLPTVQDFLELKEGEIVAKEYHPTFNAKPQLDEQNKIVEVENVTVQFVTEKSWLGKPKKYLNAVDDVSFEVFEGETLGLVGESGCGKTTLGRSIIGLTPYTSGSITFDGKNLGTLSKKGWKSIRSDIQIIFQDPYSSLNPRSTIKTVLLEPMEVNNVLSSKKERVAKIIEILELVGLGENDLNKYPHEFSGGQRQRISIARALLLEPKLIICDESVSALDVSVQAQVLNLLNELKEKFKLTYIFISHDLSVVKYMSDRMMVMNKGKVEEFGNAEAIYKNPASDYTKKLIDAIPLQKLEELTSL